MKNLSIIIIILTSMIIVSCDQKMVNIKTDYYDLPLSKKTELKNVLKLDERNEITGEGLEIIKGFLERTVLSGRSPFGPHIVSNYFWYIYHALPSFVDEKERHNGYYRDEGIPDISDQLLAYACYRIDRSPANLRCLFNLVKPVLLKVLPYEQYHRMNADLFIDRLTASYNEIIQIKDYKWRLSQFYDATYTSKGALRVEGNETVEKLYSNSAYGFSAYDLSELLCGHLGISRDSHLYGSPDLSFWMRRNKEGNMDTVYEILKEIQLIYTI